MLKWLEYLSNYDDIPNIGAIKSKPNIPFAFRKFNIIHG